MYDVIIPKNPGNYDAVDWAKENCSGYYHVNTRVIRESSKYVFLFRFMKEEDAIMFTLRWL